MAGTVIAPANQRVPAYYVNRKFAIQFNLPKLGALADPTKSFPSLSQNNAMALATLALTRLQLALAGRGQAAAGEQAGWDAEIAAAKADATRAEIAVKAALPTFRTSTDVLAKLVADAANPVPAPGNLPVDWATD